jgi:hypothetical protein
MKQAMKTKNLYYTVPQIEWIVAESARRGISEGELMRGLVQREIEAGATCPEQCCEINRPGDGPEQIKSEVE